MRRYEVDLQPKKQPRQARAKLMVEALIDSTARILEKDGYASLTTNRVAETAGVSIGSVYEYFPNKQSLVAAVTARTLNQIVTEVGGGLRRAFRTRDQRAAFRHWFTIMLDAHEKRRELLRVLRSEVPFLRAIPEAARFYPAMLEIATRGRKQSETEGRVHFRDPEASIFLLTSMVGAVIERTVFDRPPGISRERLVDTLTDMVLKLL